MATAAGNTTGHSPATVQGHPVFYWVLWFGGVAVIITMLLFAWAKWDIVLIEKFGLTFSGGPTMILVILMFLILSEKEIRENEVAAAFCYGKALIILSSGLHFVPLGLMQIRKGPRTVQQFQSPGEPEKIFKGDDRLELPPSMVRAIRVVTGGPKTGENDILATRMTITLSFFVQWAITDVLAYASNYGSNAEIERQVRDIGEAILAEIATGYTPASFIDNLTAINQRLVTELGSRFENSGVNIISTRLISPDISHDVSSALANIPKVRAEAEQAKIRADGEKVKRSKEGEGTAAAELALLNAQAAGRKKMMDELKVGGEAVLAAEAVRGLSDKTDVLVAGAEGGMKDVLSLVKGAQSALNLTKGATP